MKRPALPLVWADTPGKETPDVRTGGDRVKHAGLNRSRHWSVSTRWTRTPRAADHRTAQWKNPGGRRPGFVGKRFT